MTDTQWTIIGIVIVLAIVYFARKRMKKDDATPTTPSNGQRPAQRIDPQKTNVDRDVE